MSHYIAPDKKPAFPTPADSSVIPGMHIRDYFAGQVISSCQIVADPAKGSPTPDETRAVADRIADVAYIIADAMMYRRLR